MGGKDDSDAWLATTPNGMPVQHPLVQLLRATRTDMQRLLDKFGLSPAEQASVTTALRAQMKLFDGDGTAEKSPASGQPSFADFDD